MDIFFKSHNEFLRPYNKRVKSLIFYRNEEEFQIAKAKIDSINLENKDKKSIYTELKKFDVFYLAEPYNQHKYLKLEISLYEEIKSKFNSDEEVLLSVLASKLNGVVYGFASQEELEDILSKSSLSDESMARLREILVEGKKNK